MHQNPVTSTGAFEAVRGRLFGLAYRMLGSRADAEDIVQEAYIRWHQPTAAGLRTRKRGWSRPRAGWRSIGCAA